MQKEPIETLKRTQEELSNKIGFSILIASMLSALTSSLVAYFDKWSLYIILCITGILFLIAIFYVVKIFKEKSITEIVVEGFFLYDSQTNMCLPINRYNYSWSFVNNLKALFAENSNEKKMWNKDRLKFFEVKNDKFQPIKNNFSVVLLKEDLEYCVLDTLSTTLTDYFANDRLRKNYIQTYKQNDIPDFLAKNRFLNTFSRSMEERNAFLEKNPKHKAPGTVVLAFGKNGEKYDRFDLVLPKNSTVKKKDTGFTIKTPKLVLQADFHIGGCNYCTPSNFEEYYLNDKRPIEKRSRVYKFDIKINVKFNFWRALFVKVSKTHKWVDKFVNELQTSYSGKEFFSKINWEHNLLIYEAILCKDSVSIIQKD